MIIIHGPFIVDTNTVVYYFCQKGRIKIMCKHHEIVIDFYNDSIMRWVYDELVEKIKNSAFIFDIDYFLKEKHLATMYDEVTKELINRTP